MYKRDIENILEQYKVFPVIVIVGPRQSGKTTLSKNYFKNYVYLSLEDLKNRELARTDGEKFIKSYENEHGMIIDEFQHVPELLSTIQIIVDVKKRPGYFVLTGSQNFLMNEAISQTLAGRVGILTLFPFSVPELEHNNLLNEETNRIIFNGFYPRIYQENIAPSLFYPSYMLTYVERDVRQLAHVGDLNAFLKFIKLCAGRVGQLLNISEIAGVAGINSVTAKRWISILESSYIIFLLQPYFNNFNKRVTKAPKIYFYDTGILCNILDIASAKQLEIDRLYGNLFENFIIADVYKQFFNKGKRPNIYFWRDKNGRMEIDCLIDKERTLYPIEIKSSHKIASDFFDQLKKWQEITKNELILIEKGTIVYGAHESRELDDYSIVSWQDTKRFI